MTSLPPLPSLQALRVLESAVRHKSFTKAANELGVTHGAVSRQIQALEFRLGVSLFRRNGPHLRPTEGALALAARTGHALRSIGEAFALPHPCTAKHRLRLTTTASFARFWLAPRLADLDLLEGASVATIETCAEPILLGTSKFDVAIRYGPGGWPHVQSRLLGHERSIPVAAPGFARRLGACDTDAIAGARLIDNTFVSWRAWLAAAGLSPATSLNFVLETSDSTISMDAAIAGIGVALARQRLASRLIARGELVPLSHIAVDDKYAYHLVWASDSRRSGAIDTLAEWLAAEFAVETEKLGLPLIENPGAG